MKCVFILVFCFSFLTGDCFSYEIKPYPEQSRLNQNQSPLKLVFCPRNYPNQADFLKDVSVLIQRLEKTKPFENAAGKIGSYYIELGETEGPVFKETNSFPPLAVYQAFLDGILNKLKPAYKLVIINRRDSISCAELSSKDKLSLIILGRSRYKSEDSFARGFLHELGHSLGLRDEGVSAEAKFCAPGPPNCAINRKEAEKLWGDLAGKDRRTDYIHGCCGNKTYIRPTIASLMNDPEKAGDFGPVNERYLRREFGL